MEALDILRLRLRNTGLIGTPHNNSTDVIAHLGAVQAQDFAAAKWSVGLRMQEATDESIERDFNEGKFLRIHVMRPTWHFVMPQDIRWMLELTSPRVKRILAPYDRKIGITEEVLSRSHQIIEKVLKGKNFQTRAELVKHLEKNGLPVRGQRLAHVLYYAELNALICSGPRRGKQFTYGLLEELVPKAKKLEREEALGRLAEKYFSSHGPAQIKDFSWWSGLSSKEANEAINLIKNKLENTTLNGNTYWFFGDAEAANHYSFSNNGLDKQAFLLSIYDEYTIAYRDRSSLSEKRDIEKMLSMGSALQAVIILHGKVAGTWKRVLVKESVEIKLSPFKRLGIDEKEVVNKAARRYGEFLNKKAVLKWVT